MFLTYVLVVRNTIPQVGRHFLLLAKWVLKEQNIFCAESRGKGNCKENSLATVALHLLTIEQVLFLKNLK